MENPNMTAAEWLACTDPRRMLALLHGKASERSLRLFACACCRRMWDWLSEARSRQAVEMAERYADGEVDGVELYGTSRLAENAAEMLMASAVTAGEEAQANAAFAALHVTLGGDEMADYASSNASSAAFHAATANNALSAADARDTESLMQTHILRDIFSIPFRTVTISPFWLRWNDAAVVRLAQAAYDNRILPTGTLDNTRLAILADALEEAGCTDEQILTHLRSGGEHYRGCWGLDTLLGKS
jgi:hypothetical protein